MEIWKPVLDNDAYEVSDQGRVRRAKPGKATRVHHILAQGMERTGYLRVRLSPDRKRNRRIHRLVWEAFNGPIPEGLMINHENGIKTDNRLSNLTICTHLENVAHAIGTGLFIPTASGGGGNPSFGAANGSAKLNGEIVRHIRALKAQGMTGAAIARHLVLAERTVQHVISGRYWSSVV